MSAFEFFFSLFGLILGLSVAVVIGGLTDILRERNRTPIGWLTPMLAIFVLFDLTTLWVNAWSGLSEVQVTYGAFCVAMVISGVYFFSANMVFPKVASDWETLDDYYMSHHRLVLGGILIGNLGIAVMDAVANHSLSAFFDAFRQSEVTALWWITLVTLCVVSRRRVQFIGLTIMLLIAAYAAVAFWTPK